MTPEHPRAAAANVRIREQRKDFLENYYDAPDNVKYHGTKLGIVNAYYDWITHHRPTRASSNFEEVRFGNLMNGTGVNRRLIASA